jgi:outer membrane protein assembly factor BamA
MAQVKDDEVLPVSSDEQPDTLSRTTSVNVYPYVFYTPQTQFAAGAGGVVIFYTAKDKDLLPSKVGLGGYYTTSGQYKVSVNPVLYFLRNKLYFQLPVSFGHFVDKFWGIGNNTVETGNESYERDVFAISFTVQAPPLWFSADRAGVIFDYDHTEISDKKDNAILIGDEVTGSNGGDLYGFGADFVWDSRDNIFFPNKGGYQYAKIVVYPGMSDYVFSFFELDVRNYRAFSPDHVLAGNLYMSAATGETPFYKLPALGGQNRMRGYFTGRYRDNIYITAQLEYRQYFWRRFGFVVFGSAGDVAGELRQFTMNSLKFSAGAGLRFLFNKKEKVNLRVDLGFGEAGERGIYFGIQEAF